MVAATRAIADTSIFVGIEARRFDRQKIATLQFAVSVVTLGELRVGVISAQNDPVVAARRLATYEIAKQIEPLPVTERVSDEWALLVAKLRATGRKAPINDTWIAATALAHNLPVATQDDGYDAMPGLTVIKL